MGSYHLSYVHQLNAIELGGPQCCGSVSRAAGHVRGELPATRRCYPKLAGGFFFIENPPRNMHDLEVWG